jgi:hypothetical protein
VLQQIVGQVLPDEAVTFRIEVAPVHPDLLRIDSVAARYWTAGAPASLVSARSSVVP